MSTAGGGLTDLPASTTAYKLEDHHNHRQHQQNVNETANGGSRDQPEGPEDNKNNRNCKQHDQHSFGVITESSIHFQNGRVAIDRLFDSAHWRPFST